MALVALAAGGCVEGDASQGALTPLAGGPSLAPPGVVPPCAVPVAPLLDRLHRGARLVFTSPSGGVVEVGEARSPVATRPQGWRPGAQWRAETLGATRLFARALDGGCDVPFAHTYLVADGYAPAAGEPGSTAVAKDDPRIVGWATGWVEPVAWGADVTAQWRQPERALGPAEGDATAVVSLGRGGALTLTFTPAIADGPGPDLAVFENAFSDTFLELGFVEVSSDGEHFERFDSAYLGEDPLGPYGTQDPELIGGLAGKYRGGFGVPFDLALLRYRDAARDGRLDLGHITHVRVVDLVGDGAARDSFGHPIYDPYPTTSSAGFDLDAVAALNVSGRGASSQDFSR